MSGRKVFLTGTIKLLAVLTTILSLLCLLPSVKLFFAPLEIIANFQGYYLFGHIFACIALFFLKTPFRKFYRLLHFLQFIFVVRTLLFIAPFYFPSAVAGSVPVTKLIRVLYANVHTSNTARDALKDMIQLHKPDIVALVEMDNSWSESLALKTEYPNYFEELRSDNFGIALYSKFKLGNNQVSDFGDNVTPAYYNTIEIDSKTNLHFVLLHAMPPGFNEALYMNRMLLRRAATKLRFLEEPAIVAGDFNATQFSGFYQSFTDWSNLRDSFEGRGLFRTWNAEIGLLRLTLDYVLYKNLVVNDSKVMPGIGSDHFPILTEFYIPQKNNQ